MPCTIIIRAQRLSRLSHKKFLQHATPIRNRFSSSIGNNHSGLNQRRSHILAAVAVVVLMADGMLDSSLAVAVAAEARKR